MSNAKPPYQVLSDDNRGPLITLVSVTLLIVAFIFVAAKLGSVIYFKQRRPAVNTPIWVALILSIIQVVLMEKSIHHGLGRHVQTLTTADIHESSKYIYAAQLIHTIILSLSELSTTLLLWNLTPSKGIRQTCAITVGLIGAWTMFAFFGIAFQCKFPHPWLYTPDRCTGTILYPISAIHIVTELIIITIPFIMMSNVQMTPAKRMKILCSFSARLTIVGLAIAQLVLLPSFLNSSDITWTIVNPTICSQAMMCVTVTIACLPTLYHIFAGFHSGLLTTRLPDEVELRHRGPSAYGSGRRTKRSFYTDTTRLSNITPSVFTDITSSRKNGDTMGRSSESAESLRHLTKVSTQEGVLKTVDITVEVQKQSKR
ncbi:hypothetical protein BDV26DRAFT_271081 [Aspergillus bertholletiae]|uniref:Rhodopsin domain-containing protein n=1 Tax=Aspergillus bertholletiae TaxID=1226010 RepID=A0A5N7AY88_9EURO|nr:hypothetical protein BDV26DRAFT_271081 [Aspergillus bertholletiae]